MPSSHLANLRRFLTFQAFLFWQGGFVFYAVVVVPVGTRVLDSAGQQGQITRQVTNWLNLIGLLWHLIFAWDVLATRDPSRVWHRLRWFLWGFSLILLAALFLIHRLLDKALDTQTRDQFLFWHGSYLWISTAQWLLAIILAWLTLTTWRAEVE